ncbi:MAG: hypothetical protein AAGH15_24375 [Myxococcota bacterium]
MADDPTEGSPRPRRLRRALAVLGLLVGGCLLTAVIAGAIADAPRPVAIEGRDPEPLAARVEAAVDLAAWERTGAVRWDFGGRHQHLWDRRRSLAEVRWGDTVARIRLADRSGEAYEAGERLEGAAARAACEKAYGFWANDSFWLNPLAKLRDEGVTLGVAALEEGGEGLLVSYASGGVTPGDAYLWELGTDGKPTRWRMWVQILPVGGVPASWDGWEALPTGAVIATRHALGPVTLEITDLEGAETLGELTGGRDPFFRL